MAKQSTVTNSPKAEADNTPRLRVIPDDETFSRTVVPAVDDKTVAVTYAVKVDAKSTRRYEVKTTLDFSQCSDEDLLRLAADSAIISVQRLWRVTARGKDAASAYDAAKWSRINVKTDIIDVERSRGPVDPVLAVRRNLEKMGLSAAQVEAMVSQITAAAPAS